MTFNRNILIFLSLLFLSKTNELWKDPNYMVVSKTPLCIDALIDVSNELIVKKGYTEFEKYLVKVVTEISRIFSWHNIKFNMKSSQFFYHRNPFIMGRSIAETMPLYREWVRKEEREGDVQILFVNINDTSSNLGKAFVNGACTIDSFAITQVGDRTHWDPEYTALIIAHEIGHLFGMSHIDKTNATCKCPGGDAFCVMRGKSYFWSQDVPTSFDSCNMRKLVNNPKACLLDCDRPLYNSNPPVCGNNIKEEGEDCDCGFEESCILTDKRKICDPKTCKFVHSSFECDEGKCCQEGKFLRGFECKKKTEDCSLPSFCPGDSPYCPENYKENAVPCADDTAYCFNGVCITKNKTCEMLFTHSNTSYAENCHETASYYASRNCQGLSSSNQVNIFCGSGKGVCGQVYCNGPISGDPYFSFGTGGKWCYTMLDDENDMRKNKVPDGGVCGPGKICYYGQCLNVDHFEMYCHDKCKKYEACNGVDGNCVPSDLRWFEVNQGSPERAE